MRRGENQVFRLGLHQVYVSVNQDLCVKPEEHCFMAELHVDCIKRDKVEPHCLNNWHHWSKVTSV